MSLEARLSHRLLRLFGSQARRNRLCRAHASTLQQYLLRCTVRGRQLVSSMAGVCSQKAEPQSRSSLPLFQDGSSNCRTFSWLSRYTARFPVRGKDIEVLTEPAAFYTTLQEEIRKAKKRIVLASLYLGTGPLEQQLVDCLHEACRDDDTGQLQVHILLDCIRGSRGVDNSRTMLLPLLRDYPDKVHVSLFHTPDLRGLWQRYVPERWNETVGVSHLKVYLFDDNLLMSGANLSDHYFTHRQDRYVMLRRCQQLTDFYTDLVATVSGLSFKLQADNTLTLPQQLQHHPFEDADNGVAYKTEAKTRIETLLQSAANKTPCQQLSQTTDQSNRASQSSSQSEVVDTWVYPLLQMGPFDVTVDDQVTHTLFKEAGPEDCIKLASGYFNMTAEYIDTVINQSDPVFEILTASPKANGFYGARGISGGIPASYTYIYKEFSEKLCQQCQEKRVTLREYSRPGWTFHGKGLWYYQTGHKLPSMTFIGSPNFGHRSVFRDLESQIAIVTDNTELQQQLHQEQQRLYNRSEVVTQETFQQPERRVPLWVILVTALIRNYY